MIGPNYMALIPTETVVAFGYEVSLAELVDTHHVAEVLGISLEEAVSRYAWQPESNDVAAALERRFPYDYAGASSAYDAPWIAFSAAVPDVAHNLVRDLPVAVDLIGGRGFSEMELKGVLEEAYYQVYEHPDVANVAGGYDIERGRVTIEALPRVAADRWLTHSRLGAELQLAPPANDAITIEVLVVDRLNASTDSHLFGGGLITGCTAGFAVIHTSGVTGLATADHCAVNRPTVTYTNHNGGGTLTLQRRDRSGTWCHSTSA